MPQIVADVADYMSVAEKCGRFEPDSRLSTNQIAVLRLLPGNSLSHPLSPSLSLSFYLSLSPSLSRNLTQSGSDGSDYMSGSEKWGRFGVDSRLSSNHIAALAHVAVSFYGHLFFTHRC